MKIAVIGLGKMGMQIADMLVSAKHSVVVFDEQAEQIDKAVAFGATGISDRNDLVQQFGDSLAVIWLMIPSEFVDSELGRLKELLPPKSIIIDGGNSDYRKTRDRAKSLATKSIQLVDVGTSGGILGRQNGFSLMVGGDGEAVKNLEPILKSLTQPNGAFEYFGPSGSGHYVKMVHNAIEYGMMQSLAEGYHLLHDGAYENLNLASAGKVWQKGSIIASALNELSAKSLELNPELKSIDGYVAESGEARWALETAEEFGIDLPAIQSAMNVRLASQKGQTSFATKLLAAMRNAFGGHLINKK